MLTRRCGMLLTVGLLAGAPCHVAARTDSLPPSERPVLSIGGRIAASPGEERHFTLRELEALGTEALETATPWTRGIQHFTGVPLRRLLEVVGASGTSLRMVALNDYAVSVPVEDALLHGLLLATRRDGQPMRVRDRGPVWLLYPWSVRRELDRYPYHERAVWQLRRIEVL